MFKFLWYFLLVQLTTGGLLAQSQRFEFSHQKMGTLFRVVLYTSDSVLAGKAASAVFTRIDSLNAAMSDYDAESELSRLNRLYKKRKAYPLSRDLCNVLGLALEVSKDADGAFDPSIGPLSRLWRKAWKRQELPSEKSVKKARKAVGYQALTLDSLKCSLLVSRKGISLDLGGIGKGYAVQEALQVLNQFGMDTALVDGGGDLAIGAPPPGKKGWKIAIPHFENERHYSLFLKHCAIATSGERYRYLESNGKRYSHIIDPRSGWGVEIRQQVSVIAPDGALADAWASALNVLEAEEGMEKLNKLPGMHAFIIIEEEGGIKTYYSKDFSFLESP